MAHWILQSTSCGFVANPTASGTWAAALILADLVLVPVQPSGLDLRAVGKALQMLCSRPE